jgi:hemerythrin-like domain-containing protein
MHASEIHRKVCADHDAIRGMLFRLEELARQVLRGERHLVGVLRNEAEALLTELLAHIQWEDEHLRPTFLDADSAGAARAERLDHEHREQRELLRYALDRLEDQTRPPLVIARNLIDLVQLVRDDMDDEEKHLLGEPNPPDQDRA